MGSSSKKPSPPTEYQEYNPETAPLTGLMQEEYDSEREQRGLADRRTILQRKEGSETYVPAQRRGNKGKKPGFYKYKTKGGLDYKINRETGKREYLGEKPDVQAYRLGMPESKKFKRLG